jgi:hypothetical protein
VIKIRTAEALVPDIGPSEVHIAIAELRIYKSPVSDQIGTELIQAGSKTFASAIDKLGNFVWNKKELPDQWE